jgi:uncharacterized protein YdeI (YjbR/CyaY-like superfamily)
LNQLYVKSGTEWRNWLQNNHNKVADVWLIFYKKETGKPSIDYEVAVEEALCFGWIDSLVRKIDEQRYSRKFTPRKDKSVWSESNKKRVKKVIKEGRMTEYGLEKVKAAKKSGKWYEDVKPDISFNIPTDFEKALKKNNKAKEYFEKLSLSQRKHYIVWVGTAKREKTIEKRIEESIKLLKQGKKLGLK